MVKVAFLVSLKSNHSVASIRSSTVVIPLLTLKISNDSTEADNAE